MRISQFVRAALLIALGAECHLVSAQTYTTHDGTFKVPAAGAFLVGGGVHAPTTGFQWKYTFTQPAATWFQPSFNDSAWSSGRGSFHRGGLEPNDATTNIDWPWPSGATRSTLWARSTFLLTDASMKHSLMFWGRWDDNIKIYINGHLANDVSPQNANNSSWTPDYRYIGISDVARNSMVPGTNRIAVEAVDFGGGAHLNLGLVKSFSMAKLPVSGHIKSQPFHQLVSSVTSEMSRLGIPAGQLSIALDRSGEPDIFASVGIGYMTKDLNTSMSRHSVLRLASLDKPPVRSAVRKLISDSAQISLPGGGTAVITNNTRVFPLLRQLLVNEGGLSGAPAGSQIDQIELREFINGTTGIWDAGHGNQGSALADLRWIYTHALVDRGTYRYNNHAHFILRYFVHRVAQAMGYDGYNEYIRDVLLAGSDDKNFYIAWQDLGKRVKYPNGTLAEPWYPVGRNFWQGDSGLGHYFAGATTADAYTKYLIEIPGSETWNGGMSGTQAFSRKGSYTDESGRLRRYAFSLFFAGAFDTKDAVVNMVNNSIRALPCSAWSASGVCQ